MVYTLYVGELAIYNYHRDNLTVSDSGLILYKGTRFVVPKVLVSLYASSHPDMATWQQLDVPGRAPHSVYPAERTGGSVEVRIDSGVLQRLWG